MSFNGWLSRLCSLSFLVLAGSSGRTVATTSAKPFAFTDQIVVRRVVSFVSGLRVLAARARPLDGLVEGKFAMLVTGMCWMVSVAICFASSALQVITGIRHVIVIWMI